MTIGGTTARAKALPAEECEADPGKGAYFPRQYLVDFLAYLAARPERFQFITYDDLCWDDDFSHPYDYLSEFRRWQAELRSGRRDRGKIYILLQHDVDSRPERTLALLKYEQQLRVPSNVMVFSRRIDRKLLKHDGILAETPYEVNREYLRVLQDHSRFVIGYHCNAYERSNFDRSVALDIFEKDVADLRRDFTIDYFSPHGGVAAPDGRNNRDVDIPVSLQPNIRWVHNAFSPTFNATYSDGGINNVARDPDMRDLFSFVRSWKPGGRYRILTHPQYYHVEYGVAKVLKDSTWYRRLLSHYERFSGVSLWETMAEEGEL